MKTDDIKKMGLAYVQVLEAKKVNKHGHDAVGHEDDDIDNDGDTDKSDSYLHNRRKAIKANMKKEEVEIDEAFKKGDVVKPTKGPHKGVPHEVIHDYGDGNYNIKPKGLSPKQIRYSMGAAKAHQSDLVKEEVEELDELSKKTLGSYIKKAADNMAGSAYNSAAAPSAEAGKGSLSKALKRGRGIAKATDRLTKEETAWPVFARIQEKNMYKVSGVGDDPHTITVKFADDKHTKGATKAEPIDSKFSQGEKDWVTAHGGHDGNESGVDGHKAAADTAKAGTANVKVAPGRHNDQKVGDKTMPKSKG